jgi:hypothetical protein
VKKTILLWGAFLISIATNAQLILTKNETEALKEICNQYPLASKKKDLKTLRKKSPERFKTFVEQFLATKSKPKNILQARLLHRPGHEDLVYWYVLRELHYNRQEPDSLKKNADGIIKNILKDTIDERWLLDNYYYRLSNRLGFLFNEADLSGNNFELEQLGFKNETEKAIFFFFMINSCGERLSVMSFTGKGNPESVIKRLPKINGKEYYYYNDFKYEDFKWVGYKKFESYNARHLGVYYGILLNHLNILLNKGLKDEAKHLFRNSILSKPDLFVFTGSRKTLEDLYSNWK